MKAALDQRDMLLAAWRTNNRVTVFLCEHLPGELWRATVPGAPRRTIRMIAGHVHNARCMWIKTLGEDTASRRRVPSIVTKLSKRN